MIAIFNPLVFVVLTTLLQSLIGKLVMNGFHYENMSVQYAAISKSGKNDNF